MSKKCETCGGAKVKWVGHLHKRHRVECPDCARGDNQPKLQENKR